MSGYLPDGCTQAQIDRLIECEIEPEEIDVIVCDTCDEMLSAMHRVGDTTDYICEHCGRLCASCNRWHRESYTFKFSSGDGWCHKCVLDFLMEYEDVSDEWTKDYPRAKEWAYKHLAQTTEERVSA